MGVLKPNLNCQNHRDALKHDPSTHIEHAFAESQGLTPQHAHIHMHLVTDRGRCQRSARVCQRCEGGQVEDEFHMVFECSAYAGLRSRNSQLFAGFGSPRVASRDMARFMIQNPAQVAVFVHECWLERGGEKR